MARQLYAAMAIAILTGCGGKDASAPPPASPTAAAPPPGAAASAAPASETPTPAAAKASAADLEKKAVAGWYAAFNAHDAAKLGSLYAADAVSTRPGPGGWTDAKGPEAIGKGFAGLFAGFPDLKATPIRVFQKNDVVAVQWAAAGTNGGEMMGGPATNKKAGIYGCDLLWFDASGAIKRQESFHDDATTMRQLGKMPGKAREPAVLSDKEPEWIVAAGSPEEDALVERMKNTWPAAWSKHDAKAYEAVLNDDSEHIDYAAPSDFKGRPALLKEYETYAKALPDMNTTIDKGWGFAPGSVVAEFTFTGTMKGNLGPLKATNKPIAVHGLEIDELKDGKLQRGYTYTNGTELLAAAGALPKAKAQKAATTENAAASSKAGPGDKVADAPKAGASDKTSAPKAGASDKGSSPKGGATDKADAPKAAAADKPAAK